MYDLQYAYYDIQVEMDVTVTLLRPNMFQQLEHFDLGLIYVDDIY